MDLYATVILLTVLLMIAMTFHVLQYSGFSNQQKRWYATFFLCILLCAAAEYIGNTYNAVSPHLQIPLTLLTIFQFSISAMLPLFFARALGLVELFRKIRILFVIHALIEIVAAPFGWIFYYDAAGAYVRGPYYSIFTAFYFYGIIILIVSLILTGNRFYRRDTGTVVMAFIISVAGLVPMVFFEVYGEYVGIADCALLCYIYYNDLTQQDTMTDLVAHQEQISRMQTQIITGLASLIENRDEDTGEHVARTSTYVKTLAEKAREDGVYEDELDDHFIDLLYRAAPMHDVGKIVVPDHVLKKPGRLTDEEFAQMKMHASAGGRVIHEILEGITDEEYMQFASDIATYHHERWDGQGYPEGLAGDEIPLSARIMAVADVYDALISERCYKKAMPIDQALNIIREESGTHFDPQLAKVFLNHSDLFIPE